jgi:hypothetical protein
MKRQRQSSITYEIKGDYVVITYNERQYAWRPPIKGSVDTFLNQQTFEYEIIHNRNGQAMFNVENMRTNEHILRQEINPLAYKDVDDWVRDE